MMKKDHAGFQLAQYCRRNPAIIRILSCGG